MTMLIPLGQALILQWKSNEITIAIYLKLNNYLLKLSSQIFFGFVLTEYKLIFHAVATLFQPKHLEHTRTLKTSK